MLFLICLVVGYASHRMRRTVDATIDQFTLGGVSDYLDFRTKIAIAVSRLGRLQERLGMVSIVGLLQRTGRFTSPDVAVDDFVEFNMVELESVIKVDFNLFDMRNYRQLRAVALDYVRCQTKPLCKYLPKGLRHAYDALFRPGPTYNIINGDLDLAQLESVYATLRSDAGGPGIFGPRSLSVDESLDKQFFSFASFYGEAPETDPGEWFFVDKVTGQSARYMAEQRDFRWLPSKRTIVVSSARRAAHGRCLDLWRANSDAPLTIPPNSYEYWWVTYGRAGDRLVDFNQQLEISIDYKEPLAWRPCALEPRPLRYPQFTPRGSLRGNIDMQGHITIRSSVNHTIHTRFRGAVRSALSQGRRFVGTINQIIESDYDWTLIRRFIIEKGYYHGINEVDHLVYAEAAQEPPSSAPPVELVGDYCSVS